MQRLLVGNSLTSFTMAELEKSCDQACKSLIENEYWKLNGMVKANRRYPTSDIT